jgi:hypothetical protein
MTAESQNLCPLHRLFFLKHVTQATLLNQCSTQPRYLTALVGRVRGVAAGWAAGEAATTGAR